MRVLTHFVPLIVQRESNSVRMCAVHNTPSPSAISRLVQLAHSTLSAPPARQFLEKLLELTTSTEGDVEIDEALVRKLAQNIRNLDVDALVGRMGQDSRDVFTLHKFWASKVAGLQASSAAVISNGRMLGPFDNEESFTLEDFALLEKFTGTTLTDKITEIVKDSSSDVTDMSRLIMRVSGVVQSNPNTKTRTKLNLRATERSTFTIPPRSADEPVLAIIAVMDPLTLAAQKMGSILQVLHEATNVNITVVLNAVEKHSSMPLQSFYRMVLSPRPEFGTNGPRAVFTSLPEGALLTQALHVPDNWLVEGVKGRHDLDNIKMAEVETSISSEHELANLLVEGHCYEAATGNPPRG